MKKIFLMTLLLLVFFWSEAFSREDTYGDYLINGLDEKVSLDLEGAQLTDVLKLLSQQIGLNFISTEAVKERTLTLYMKDVPLKEAMDAIFLANNLACEYYPDSNLFVVKEMFKPARELKTKVYYLKHARVKSSKMEAQLSAMLSGEEGKSGEAGEGGLKYAVEAVLTDSGRVTEDSVTNSLIVVDVPAQFFIIDEVINKLDISIPTVMIEVEMLDVSKNTSESFGVNWPETLAALDMTLAQRATSWPFSNSGMKNVSGDGATILYEDATPSGWSNVSWSTNNFGPTILTVVGAELALDFLKTQTDTKYLARPKILTLANQTAEIRITTDEAIGISKTESEENTTYEIERAETGIRLRVTPQVDKNSGDITLCVEMVVKEAKNSGFVATSEALISGTIKDPEERKTVAVVCLKDNQTFFMGGLIKTERDEEETKVPILGDLPFLGRFFRHKETTEEQRELMVFLTPHVVNETVYLAENIIIFREQQNFSKESSVKIALDCYK